MGWTLRAFGPGWTTTVSSIRSIKLWMLVERSSASTRADAMRLLLHMALVVALMTGSGEAQEMRNIAGLGNAPCEAWTAVRHGQHKMDFEQWILGFLSGAGFAAHAKDPLHGRNPDAVWA